MLAPPDFAVEYWHASRRAVLAALVSVEMALQVSLLLRSASLDDELHAQEADRLCGLFKADALHGRVPQTIPFLKHSGLRGR